MARAIGSGSSRLQGETRQVPAEATARVLQLGTPAGTDRREAYGLPADFTARDFGKIDSLIKCFRVIHGELQPFVGAPVTVKQGSPSQGLPRCRVLGVPQPRQAHITLDTSPTRHPLAPPTLTLS